MKYSTATILLILFTIRVFSQLPDFEWANQCGNPPNTTDTKTILASGPDGNFYLSGEFLDTAQFGSKMLVSAGGTDIFLVKHSAEGEVAWSARIGAADYDFVQNVMTDAEGNVIVTGYFYGLTWIGTDQYTSYGSQDLFMAKFNTEGEYLWSLRLGGPMADYITGLAIDADQNLVISGYFYDSIAVGDTTILSISSSDIFLAKFNPAGEMIWAASAGGSSSDQARSASIDPEGNVLLSGSFYYDITLGDTTLSTMNPVGVVIAKYLPDGQLDRAFQLDGTYLTPEVYLAAGVDGDFFISGNFSEEVVFGNKTFNAGEFNQDIYLAKYDSSCDLQWARHAFSFGSDQIVGIETDPYNNLYLTGHYLDTIHFDLLTLPYTLCCGSREIFIVNYDASGNLLWGEQISGTRANIQSLEMNQQGELLLSGLFSEEVIFGHLTLSNFDGFQNYVTCLQTETFTTIRQDLKTGSLKVFPNPATENIQFGSNLKDVNYNYQVYSMNGRLSGDGTVKSGNKIDISALPAGQYLLHLTDTTGSAVQSCLFIKQ